MPRRFAILIGNQNFISESDLDSLAGPRNDIQRLGALLGDSGIGNFQVELLFDKTSHEIGKEIADVFAKAEPDDMIFIHYSGHGKIDLENDLYLAGSDTVSNYLYGTSVAVDTIRRTVRSSRCRSLVISLDCCYSGAAGERWRGEEERLVSKAVQGLDGSGVHILASAGATSPSREQASDEMILGDLTRTLLAGIGSGAADIDHNGVISITELAAYVKANLPTATYNARDDAGNLTIAWLGTTPRTMLTEGAGTAGRKRRRLATSLIPAFLPLFCWILAISYAMTPALRWQTAQLIIPVCAFAAWRAGKSAIWAFMFFCFPLVCVAYANGPLYIGYALGEWATAVIVMRMICAQGSYLDRLRDVVAWASPIQPLRYWAATVGLGTFISVQFAGLMVRIDGFALLLFVHFLIGSQLAMGMTYRWPLYVTTLLATTLVGGTAMLILPAYHSLIGPLSLSLQFHPSSLPDILSLTVAVYFGFVTAKALRHGRSAYGGRPSELVTLIATLTVLHCIQPSIGLRAGDDITIRLLFSVGWNTLYLGAIAAGTVLGWRGIIAVAVTSLFGYFMSFGLSRLAGDPAQFGLPGYYPPGSVLHVYREMAANGLETFFDLDLRGRLLLNVIIPVIYATIGDYVYGAYRVAQIRPAGRRTSANTL